MFVYIILGILCSAYNTAYIAHNAKMKNIAAVVGAAFLAVIPLLVCAWLFFSVE